jgi:hypothetical protein
MGGSAGGISIRLSAISARSALSGGSGQGAKASGLVAPKRLISARAPFARKTRSGCFGMI